MLMDAEGMISKSPFILARVLQQSTPGSVEDQQDDFSRYSNCYVFFEWYVFDDI